MPKEKKKQELPQSSAQQLGSIVKSCRDIMRKDKGLNGDLDRLPVLTWIMFLKFLDDMETIREEEYKLAGKRFKPGIELPYRWRDWAAKPDGITGPELIAFVNQDETVRPDGTRGAGLFAYLRSLQSANGDRRDVIARVFQGTVNRMINGYLLRDVINKVNEIHFASKDEIHTLGHLYESMLREMRDAAGDSGEFYTPRPIVKFIVAAVNPRLGETVLDPAAGTGGFLVESYEHLRKQAKKAEDYRLLQGNTIQGIEAKPLPYLLCEMNLLLHGVEYPEIDPENALRFPLREIGDKERVDVIVTNPPFGGEEERGILSNFPDDKQTAETALLFLQLIMRKLRRPVSGRKAGRAAVIVPNTTLFYPGIAGRIRQELLTDFNLRAIVRLPKGVFEPYTDIETNVLFFDRSGPTSRILFYKLNPPDNRKQYSKTQPLKLEELNESLDLLKKNSDKSPSAWFVEAAGVLKDPRVSLDVQNPKELTTTAEEPLLAVEKFSASVGEILQVLNGAQELIREIKALSADRLQWNEVSIGSVLKRHKDEILIEDGTKYKRLRIQVKGRGIAIRDEKDGAEIGTKRQFIVHAGQFVLSKIDARNGAFGIAPEEADGAVITGNFWAYEVDRSLIDPRFLHHLTRSDAFISFCSRSSPGATNRRYLQEGLFLAQTIRIPTDVELQSSICDALDQLDTVSRSAEKNLQTLGKKSPLILQSMLHEIFGGDARSIDSTVEDSDGQPEDD